MDPCPICGADLEDPYGGPPRAEAYYLLARVVDVLHLARQAAGKAGFRVAAATCSAMINTVEALTEHTEPSGDA